MDKPNTHQLGGDDLAVDHLDDKDGNSIVILVDKTHYQIQKNAVGPIDLFNSLFAIWKIHIENRPTAILGTIGKSIWPGYQLLYMDKSKKILSLDTSNFNDFYSSLKIIDAHPIGEKPKEKDQEDHQSLGAIADIANFYDCLRLVPIVKVDEPMFLGSRERIDQLEPCGEIKDLGVPSDWARIKSFFSPHDNKFEVCALTPGLLLDEIEVRADPAGQIFIVGHPSMRNMWGFKWFTKVVCFPKSICARRASGKLCMGTLHVTADIEGSALGTPPYTSPLPSDSSDSGSSG